MQDGDTLQLLQHPTSWHSDCNVTREIQVDVTKSFILKTGSQKAGLNTKSVESVNLHGIQLTLNDNCSHHCSLTISESHFSCSSITFHDLDIQIKDTRFKNSFIIAKAKPGNHGNTLSMRIHDSELKNNFPVKIGTEAPISNGQCKKLNYVCLSGNWNSIEIVRSILEGDRQSQVSGVEVMHANIQTLSFIDVTVCFMHSALVIWSSGLDTFNVLGSVFMGNRDGIDIGQGTRLVLISGSEMNNTGSWFGDGNALEQCSSALKGGVQILKVEDSVFAHNYAHGMNCNGVALCLRSNIIIKHLPESNHDIEIFETENLFIQTIKIVRSKFYENMVANCSVGLDFDNLGGGAVTVYGAKLLIQISGSLFVRNEACKGAGLYVGMSDRWLMGNSHDGTGHEILFSRVIIDECTFNDNIAEFGGGLMTEFAEFTLDNGSSVSILIYGSSFHNNNASNTGAGALLVYLNVSIYNGATVMVQFGNTDFKGNINTGVYPHGHGGGMSVNLTSLSLLSRASVIIVANWCSYTSNTAGIGETVCNYTTRRCYRKNVYGGGIYLNVKLLSLNSNASLRAEVNNCSFTSNRAFSGAGLYTGVAFSSVDLNSFIRIQTSGSKFTLNNAERDGAGYLTEVSSCSADLNSSILLQVTGSVFLSNIADIGAGICTQVHSCSMDSDSLLILEMIDSTFTSNTVWNFGGGIFIFMASCSVGFNSLISIKMINSAFRANKAEWVRGAGTKIAVRSISIYSNASFTIQTTDSSFISNTAAHDGAGIYTAMFRVSFYPYSAFILQISNSTFKLNTAGLDGAGSHTDIRYCSIHPNSFFQIQVTDCRFASGKADRGAGISFTHEGGCVSGEVTVAIADCRFLNNSASREGGSLYLKVSQLTQVHMEHSVFETNQALPGSGLYRENIDVKACDTLPSKLNTQGLITTYVVQCQFIDNIDTAILVQSKQKFGTLAITNCSFMNNVCIKSFFAEDIFTNINLELVHTEILRDRDNRRTISINAQSVAELENVTVTTLGLSYERQINIATFSHYLTQGYSSSIEYQCPPFYQPLLSHAGLTDFGGVLLKATCDACLKGYYIGKSWIVISNEDRHNHYCYEKFERDDSTSNMVVINKLCHTNVTGTCIQCPHGANCSAGVVALPNYWGHMAAADRLEFHKCPVGYCCNKAPCQGIEQCASNREGTLCGRCAEGFTESLITPECIPDQICSDWWIFPLFSFWTLTVTLVLVFSQDILKIKEKIHMHLKTSNSMRENANKSDDIDEMKLKIDIVEVRTKNPAALGIGLRRRHSVEIRPIQHTVSSSNVDKEKSAYLDSIKIQASECPVKVPIFWGLLTIQRKEKVETAGSHKYLQIMLYYLQDASLMQIDLAFVSTVITPIQKLRQMLLSVSQLAVDLIDLGLNLCPIPGWTPVSKLFTKNLTGPFVFCWLLAIYGIVRFACLCSPTKRKPVRDYWYARLTAAAIFSILLFYQQIANVAFALLYCINSGDRAILFIDGNITCYQPWQIVVFIFAFNWVVGIIPVLVFLPGLLELQLINVSHFFFACLMPGPMLLYWLQRFYRKKSEATTPKDIISPWHEEATNILQKTFVKTTDRKGLPICWVGFVKVRRLALVLLFTFVSNLIARVTLMCIVIQLFLIFHLKTEPYQDDLANKLYTCSLLATLAIGFINIMKAACVEFYLDLDKVAYFLTTLNMITDGILVYCPLGFVGLTIAAILVGKVRQIILSKKFKISL